MSVENSPGNKSIQDLEKEKLQAEIDILKAQLATEYPIKDKETGWFEKVAIHVKGWSAFILGAVTLISAVWGVFLPLSEYLVEQRRVLEFQLNQNMIGFVDDLNSEDPAVANKGVMMLSYYQENSIPILLFFLEGSRNDQVEFREKIIETVSLIYEDSGDERIMDIILSKMEKTFTEIRADHEANGVNIDPARRRAMFNYLDLINGMNLSNSDKNEIETLYRDFKSQICQDETFEMEIFSIFSNICIYLGEDIICE